MTFSAYEIFHSNKPKPKGKNMSKGLTPRQCGWQGKNWNDATPRTVVHNQPRPEDKNRGLPMKQERVPGFVYPGGKKKN